MESQLIERQQQQWVDNWAKKMIEIWQDKLEIFNIKDTGKLMSSFTESVAHDGLSANIIMRFLAYGIYQAYGVGREFRTKEKGNYGDLPFLSEAYREEHHLDEPRKVGPAWGGGKTSGWPRRPRDWFNPKLYASLMRMKDTMAHMVGEDAAAVLCEALENARNAIAR